MGVKVAVAKVRKAVAAAVATAVVAAVGKWIDIDEGTIDVIVDAVVVSAVVWAVPNAKDVFDA